METSRKALCLTSSVCLLALAACSGGGGGGASVNTTPSTTTPSTTTPSTTTPTPPATVSIAPPNGVGVSGFSGLGSSFTTNPPPVGSKIPLGGNSVAITPTSVADSGVTNNTITATYRGTAPGTSVPIFDFSIPSLSVTATNLRADGTPVTVSNGGQVAATFATMTYTLVGAWAYTPTGGNPSYIGQVVTGYSTAASAVPTTGTASYTGNPNTALGGGVIGAYAVPAGNGTIAAGTLAGNVSINANFAANTATGNFTNMVATPVTGGGSASPWNDVSFSANFSRSTSGVTMSGNMTAAAPPANAGVAGFAAGSGGGMVAEFYGPAAQEVGGNWFIREGSATNGKAAFGTFGAK